MFCLFRIGCLYVVREPCCLKWWQELKNKEMCWVHVGEPCFMTTSAFVVTISPILASAVVFSWELGLHDPSLSCLTSAPDTGSLPPWVLVEMHHTQTTRDRKDCRPLLTQVLVPVFRHRLGAKVLLFSSPAVQGHPWGDCWCMATSNPCFCSDFRIVLGKQIGLLTL